MLTVVTIPKPFVGRSRVPQDNAVASWKASLPDAQIILLGDEEGIEEAARRHGVEHGGVVRNVHGTPRLDEAFAQARRRARHALLCYVNADILFTPDLQRALPAMRALPWPRFVVVGRRTDLDYDESLDPTTAGWDLALKQLARTRGRLHEATGIDYMILPRGWALPMPPFPVGRVLWDNWLIHEARRTGAPVVDATRAITAVHQNHDYAHIGGPRRRAADAEIAENWRIVGPDFLPLTIADATHGLDDEGVRPLRDAPHVLRRLLVAPALTPGLRRSVRIARRLYRLVRPA